MIEDYDKIPVENNTWKFNFYPFEDESIVEVCLWEDGDIWLNLGNQTNKIITVSDLSEIVRRSKMFVQQRKNYLARMSKRV